MSQARALYDYVPQDVSTDLALTSGEIVLVTHRDSSGWWRGSKFDGSASGQFPGEYVELLVEKRKPPPPPAPSSAGKTTVRVLWDYQPREGDELGVEAEEVLQVVASADPEWWLANKNGKAGIFPKNYTEIVAASSSSGPPVVMPRAQASVMTAAPPAPSMISTGGAFSLGGNVPIWYHPAYVGYVADLYRTSSLTTENAKDEFAAFAESCEFAGIALDRVANRIPLGGVSKVLHRALIHGAWVASNVPVFSNTYFVTAKKAPPPPPYAAASSEVQANISIPSPTPADEEEIDFEKPGTPWQDYSERFYLFLHTFTGRVRDLRTGDAMIIPSGWCVDASSRALVSASSIIAKSGTQYTPPPQPRRGRFICVLSYRGTPGDTFDLSILHDGLDQEGLDYHTASFDSTTGKTKRSVMSFEGIPRTKLTDSSFWFMWFRLVVFPHKDNTIAHVYETLLPYLNQVPLRCAESTKPKMFVTTRPRPGDGLSRFHLVKKAMRAFLVHHASMSNRDSKKYILEFKREIAAMTAADVTTTSFLTAEEAFLARLAWNQCSNAAAKLGDDDSDDMKKTLTEVTESCRLATEQAAKKIVQSNSRYPARINSISQNTKAVWGAAFPLFGRFRREKGVDQYAGARNVPPILRPVQLSLVPDSVSSFHDVAVALKQCAHVCTLLDNQKDSIKNTYCLRVSLISHLFTRVIPLPGAPRVGPDGNNADSATCFWSSPNRPMRYETQAELLRQLELIGRHFTASALSLHVTRSFDAVRIVTMACIATVADAVARKVASDVPSQFSLHLSGKAEGPISEFGFEMGYFLEESGFLEFADPYTCAARTQILDYFHAQRKTIDEDHTIFRFEQSMEFGVGDARLVDQLCLQMGFPRQGNMSLFKSAKNPLGGAAAYLTGEDPVLVDNYPELALYRDIVFLFKALLAPTSSSLPPVKAWKATDARLTWSVAKKTSVVAAQPATKSSFLGMRRKKKDPAAAAAAGQGEELSDEEEAYDATQEPEQSASDAAAAAASAQDELIPRPTFDVSGFTTKQLRCAAFSRSYVSQSLGNKSAIRSFLGFFGLGGDDRPRAPPSGANPSNLVNELIVTEDDVLHVRNLPDFDGRIGARDCELLLSYLTGPYVRIPLVVQFFAEQARIISLASPELQAVLDAVLFEPSLFMNETDFTKGPPTTIPAVRREQLGTPAGLLFNELQKSPHVLIRAVEDLLFYALELDVGKFSPQTSSVLLYVSRLTARVVSYMDFICENATFLAEGKPSEGGNRQRVRGVGGPLELSKAIWQVLDVSRVKLRVKLETHVFETLEGWCAGSLKDKDIQLACVMHAHMANLFTGKKILDFHSACSTLAAYVFVTSNFRFTVEAMSGEKKQSRVDMQVSDETLKRLGVPQVELFMFFQEQRLKMLDFFENHPDDRDEIMEAVVRVLTLTGTHKRRADQADPNSLQPNRNWASMDRPMCAGRYVPDTELPSYQAALAKIDSVTDFEEWLRQVTTLAVDTEINVQLGEFTLKKNPMQLLPDEFFAVDDFKTVIGEFNPTKGDALQCAEVSNSKNRQWWRLVGMRHDVQLWNADARTDIAKASPFKRPYPGGLTAGESWIREVLEPYRSSMFPGAALFLPSGATFEAQHFCRLTGVVLPRPTMDSATAEKQKAGQAFVPEKPLPPTLLELVVFKDPAVVHVYHVLEHGRRFYSCLAFTSDTFFTFADFPPALSGKRVMWPPSGVKLTAGQVATVALPPTPSLIITRNISADVGVQQYTSPKFLFGLLPSALLEQYEFWQNEADERLMGYALPRGVKAGVVDANARIYVELFKDKTVDETGYGNSMAYAVIRRIIPGAGLHGADVVHTLLNPLYAPPSSPLRVLANLFQRLENLSHVLMWSADESVKRPNDSTSIDFVELPRVRLNFKAKPGPAALADGSTTDPELLLYCEEHAGLFITSKREANVMRLIDGLQSGILLENDENDYFVLVPASNKPTRQFRPSSINEPPMSDVLMDPAHQEWLKNLGRDVRHYLYPVHSSRMFLFTPTLSSAIHLMLLRFASRQYTEAFRLADACVSDTPLSSEEKQAFEHLGSFSNDEHPDAHAVRLRIALATCGSRDAQPLPWNLAAEYSKYCAKFGLVSAACRLTVEEEMTLIASGETGEVTYDNRRVLLGAFHSDSFQGGQDLRPPPYLIGYPQFDEVVDQTALEDRKSASSWTQTLRKFASVKPVTYSRPDEITGSQALRIFEKFVRGGVSMRGTGGTVGFVFIFEMMTGTLALRILNEDSCYNWGCLFLRLLSPKKYQKQQTMTSVLRILMYNPKFAALIPKYEDTRKHKISVMFKGSNVIQKCLENANQFLRAHATEVVWPKFESAKMKINVDFSMKLSFDQNQQWRRTRLWRLNYRVSNLQCAKRSFRALPEYVEDWPKFRERPLQNEFAKFIQEKSRAQRSLGALQPKPLNVFAHPATRSKAAKDILTRVAEDDVAFCQDSNAELEPEFTRFETLVELKDRLQKLIAEDSRMVKEQIARVVTECNFVTNATTSSRALAFTLRQFSGQEPVMIGFDFLVGLSMCDTGDADIVRLNPYVPEQTKQTWQHVVAGLMFRANRTRQSWRALKLAIQCESKDPLKRKLAAETLARELAAKRHYVSGENEYDPRFLAFEFTYGMLLRQSQVLLVRDFMSAMRRAEGARCHQMIMGAGKTTVVGPLLALLLGDGKSLVVQVVPPALLEFSRSVMRECFSSALFQKPVYTFTFDRVSSITEQLVRKLRLARDARSVVCTTPTALKSFMLKLLEAAHNLDNARLVKKGEEFDEGQGIRGALQRNVFGFSRLKRKRGLDDNEKALLRRQMVLGLEIIEIFRQGALILDEVDLILHPLKSELNWPIGARLPLDFTFSKSRGVHGLRWQVPFYLLDAVFAASNPKRTLAWASDDSREARALLEKLAVVVKEGEDRRLVQKMPHFVLLSKMFYNAKMKPVLGRWLVLFLIQKGVRGVRDDLLENYLMAGPRKASAEAIKAMKEHLSDENVKLLNISHDWLDTFTPFCVSRIDRVKYGLLTKDDVDRLTTQFGPIPKNRKLLAVPFVGKDVPSRASEFSHPDVLIGLTTLAFRYEGLRYSDFVVLIRALREAIDEEHGPYYMRPSGALFIKWVELAGGRVRGTRLEERREEVDLQVAKVAAGMVNSAAASSAADSPAMQRTISGDNPDEFSDMWPIQLLDPNDPLQMDLVFRLIRYLPHAALFYLDQIVFPECMQHQGLKLSACGQELGGSMLFKRRLGFSGTPSDLLPVELGTCRYERGSDGRMIHYLSDPEICTVRRTGPGWAVKALLEGLCDCDASGKPIYHALIDTGALVTGMNNLEVAEFMLKHLPAEWMDGVVYLDSDDCKMVLLRASNKIVPYDRCGLDWGRRFTFYDQVHTTGMDIKQAASARAALTLGKDMVFRDYAQGAFRMRGIGKGQTIELIIVPEVEMLIHVQCQAGRGVQLSGADLDILLAQQKALVSGRAQVNPQFLVDIVAWLVINTCVTEKVQFNLLLEQSLNNTWRKRAFARIEAGLSPADIKFTQDEVDVFRERIDYSVENSIPKPKTFLGKLEQLARERLQFLQEDDRAVVEHLLSDARESDANPLGGGGPAQNTTIAVVVPVAGVEGDGTPEEVAKERAFNAEQVQEQEQEQEQQVEQEQEKEEERADEDQQEEFIKKKYARDDEAPIPWRVESLLSPIPPPNHFFPLSNFAVHKKLLDSVKPVRFPESVFVSKNYYHPKWSLNTFRRLKNVICFLEYVPDPAALVQPHQLPSELDPITLRNRPPIDNERRDHIRRAFGMFDAPGTGHLDGALAVEVVKAMDVDVEKTDFAFLQKCFHFADTDRSGGLSYTEFVQFLERRLFYQCATKGRFYVVLSLHEAETVRAILHHRDSGMLLNNAQVALHSLATRTVFDCTPDYQPPSDYQNDAYAELLRFFDSEVAFDDRSVGILVRALQENDPELRRAWFEDVRECRRRSRKYAVKDRPVNRVLTIPHEYIALEYRSMVVRVKELIYRRGMFMTDAFRVFDFNRDGLLSCSELFGALTWLGLGNLKESQVHDMMRALDNDKDGQLSLIEFRKAFGDVKREEAIAKAGARANMDYDGLTVPPIPIRELFEESKIDNLLEGIELTQEVVEKFRIKLKPPQGFEKVWTSAGSLSELDASIWKPDIDGSYLRANRVQLCVGHYAVKGQDRPSSGGGVGGALSMFFGSSGKDSEVTTIEIKDESRWGVSGTSIHMKAVVEVLFPFPVRYQQLWSQQRGSPIFAWRGVPPRKEFVFFGCVITTTDDPPALTESRCVPRHWVTKTEKPPNFVWKDAGATGGKKGSVWSVNGMSLGFAHEGHDAPPQNEFWDVKERAFHISMMDIDIVKGSQEKPKPGTAVAAVMAVPAALVTPAGSSAPAVPMLAAATLLAEEAGRPSLDMAKYVAPLAPKWDSNKYPVQIFPTSDSSPDVRRIDGVGWSASTEGSAPMSKAKPVPVQRLAPKRSAATALLAAPPVSATAKAAAADPPPRPQKPSSVVLSEIKVDGAPEMAIRPVVAHHDVPVMPPGRPSKPSTVVAAAILPTADASVAPPSRPSKPSSAVPVVLPATAEPPPRPKKPSSQASVPVAHVGPPVPAHAAAAPTQAALPVASHAAAVPAHTAPPVPVGLVKKNSGADELAAALAKRKSKMAE